MITNENGCGEGKKIVSEYKKNLNVLQNPLGRVIILLYAAL